MPRYFSVLLLFILGLATRTHAGVVRGRITDVKGEALAFANVAVRTTTTSTASNEQGNYQLRLAAGTYELVFQYVGFKPRLETIRVAGGDTATTLDVALTPENYQLREVVVRSTDKDPAYTIVQQAMQWRRYHQREVAAFKARTYIKTLGRFTDVPGKILGLVKVGPDIKPGIFYLSETVSEMSFRQPNVVQERMISSRVSGDTKGISFNRASAGRGLNFYQNVLKSGFSERGFVSPIAANAPLFYRYELEGSTRQGTVLIHKIRVTPRRRTDPVFSGHIYIVDGTWRLHSVSLDLTKDAQLDYVENLHIEQIFSPAPGPSDVWVMQSQKVTVGFTAFGFKGNGYITAILSNYQVTPTYANRPAPTTPAPAATSDAADDAPVTRETVAQVKKQKPKLSGLASTARRQSRQAASRDTATSLGLAQLKRGEVMLVEKGVNERDTTYWANIRPVPLTEEEVKDYQVKDSTEVIRKSRPYQDSLDRKRNELSISKFLLTGYTYSNTFRQRQWFIAPVFNILNYNTVEGLVINPQATYTQRTDDRRTWSVTPSLRYGFSNKLFSPSVAASWQLDAVKLARVSIRVGRTIENFDPNSQLTPFINTYYTLFENRNYAKLYRRDGLQLGYQWEPLNGLTVQATGSYFTRHELENTTYKLLVDQKGRAFTSNVPVAAERPDGTAFGRNQALTTELSASFRPGQRYITRPDGKFNLGSKYPTFSLTWRQGISGLLGSDVRYTLLEAGVRHSISLGLLGTSNYRAAAGFFPGSSTKLSFMDFRHFSGNRTYLTEDFTKFQLLDYYRFSTADKFLEAHYNHHFNGFLLNKVPLLRRLQWQEVFSLNYLTTPTANHYLELGVGVEHVFKVLRADFYTSLQSGQRAGTGIRVGIGF